jgi:aminocarboxymuconate-semialdehyde decarboxylase
VHSVVALQYLIQVVGADRVVIGTDYPMGMGDKEPVSKIMALSSITAEERVQVLGTNARRALGMDPV